MRDDWPYSNLVQRNDALQHGTATLDGELTVSMGKQAFDEIMGTPGDTTARPELAALGTWIEDTPDAELRRRQEAAETTFRQLGITFEANSATRQAATIPLGDVTGTGTWELPFPTALVIDQTGVVAWTEVTPDWMKRTEADAIIDPVRSIIVKV